MKKMFLALLVIIAMLLVPVMSAMGTEYQQIDYKEAQIDTNQNDALDSENITLKIYETNSFIQYMSFLIFEF